MTPTPDHAVTLDSVATRVCVACGRVLGEGSTGRKEWEVPSKLNMREAACVPQMFSMGTCCEHDYVILDQIEGQRVEMPDDRERL